MPEAEREAPLFMQALDEYGASLNRRVPRFSTPRLVELQPGPSDVVPFAGPGTLWVLVAKSGDRMLADIEAAATGQDMDELGRLTREVRERMAICSTPAAPGVDEIPVFGELRYGSKTLVEGMYLLSHYDVAAAFLPYNGADLDHSRFQFVEHHQADSEGGLEALLILWKPELSELEREILERVPGEASEVNIGAEPTYWPVAVGTAFFALGYGVYTTYQAYNDLRRQRQQEINGGIEYGAMTVEASDALRDLDPTVGARKLLELRSNLLRRGT